MASRKETLRQEAIRHRDMIDPASESPDDAAEIFFNTIEIKPGQIIASYCPKGREFDPGLLTEQLIEKQISCALPVVQKDSRVLGFALWDGKSQLVSGPFGISQPEINDQTVWVEPDIVLVPFLAFDRSGGRLGYGGGYYDATLKTLRAKKDVVAVGIGYAQQAVLFRLPHEPHDELLDWVITPQQAHYFGD